MITWGTIIMRYLLIYAAGMSQVLSVMMAINSHSSLKNLLVMKCKLKQVNANTKIALG
jgi:hypothetical protein